MSVLFINRLTLLDVSLLHPERGLLGESWIVDIELEGSLNQEGMLLDFGLVKKKVKGIIDEHFDHRLLVPATYPGLRIRKQNQQLELTFIQTTGETLKHLAPTQATALIDTSEVTADNLKQAITDKLSAEFPDNIGKIKLHLLTEKTDGASYQYSHALKKHAGNCQRIAHGHRSRIEIYRDGEHDPQLERNWAQRWRDIYIGTVSDLQASFERDGIAFYRFSYVANQGRFELELPAARCYLINTDSTVENLAMHIVSILKSEYPTSRFRVHAFEGIDKGAIGEC